MVKKLLFLSFILLLAAVQGRAQDIVPKPVKMEVTEGETFRFNNTFLNKALALRVVCSPDVEVLAQYFIAELERATPVKATVSVYPHEYDFEKKGGRARVRFYTDPQLDLPAEGYRLTVTPKSVVVAGRDYGGVFNGIQTLIQLLPTEALRDFREEGILLQMPLQGHSIPCVTIEDYPRFGYRGMHLDISRTFSTKEEVLRYIDIFSRHKLNKFHWHLTDDEGWRIQIKSRPELAEVGGFRGGDSPVMAIYGEWDRKYGGYFTHEDIREVIEYAAVRNVEIIPEIDLPGHSRTAARVYPHILCDGPVDTVSTNGYDIRDVWCASKEENYAILDDVLREVCELFPSEYVHIGGDEVNMAQWNACPLCKKTMKEEGMKNGHELECYFMSRLEQILAKYGKKAVVWNEAINGGSLSPSTVVQGWESVKACLDATEKGYRTIVMPGRFFYYDMKYTREEPGMTWANIITNDTVYSFRFEELGFTEKHMENVIGVQGTFFSEIYLSQDRDYLYRQCYPRVCALAEVAWTPEELRLWDDFDARIENTHLGRLEAWGVDYRKPPVPAEPDKLLTPGMTFSSSMPFRERNPSTILSEYRFGSSARTSRTCAKDDYLLFTFDKPVECDHIEFKSGYSYLRRCILPFGYVEVAYADAPETFVRYGELHDGIAVIRPSRPVKAIRVVSTSPRNGEDNVIFLPLRIVAKG